MTKSTAIRSGGPIRLFGMRELKAVKNDIAIGNKPKRLLYENIYSLSKNKLFGERKLLFINI